MPLGHTLIIRPGALGDAILTLPALHALRLAGAESLTVLGTLASWGFVRSAHDGLRVRDFSSTEWLGLFSESAAFGESARAILARTQTAIVYLAGDTSGVERALRKGGVRDCICCEAPRAGVVTDPPLHAARQLLQPLEKIGGIDLDHALSPTSIDKDIFLRLDETEIVAALAKLGLDAPPESGFIGLHPGSGGRSKCWPARSYARLLANLSTRGLTPLVFLGPADDAVREEFESSVAPGLDWECAAGRPLREVLALLTCCRGFVGNDSGLTHLAARACPTLALFGPTDPRVWGPLGANVEILHARNGDLSKLSVDEVTEKVSNF
jgi:heptosyltransferase III